MTTDHDTQFDTWLDAWVGKGSTPPHASATEPTTRDAQRMASQLHHLAHRSERTPIDRRLVPSWEDFMTTQGIASNNPNAAPSSLPNPRKRAQSGHEGHRRSPVSFGADRSTWLVRAANAFLTLLIVASLAAGAWLVNDRFNLGGFGQNQPPTSIPFAAMGQDDATPDGSVADSATPEAASFDPASIATADQCTIEPLTIDQVVAYMYNPYLDETPLADDADTPTLSEMETIAAEEVMSTETASPDALEGATTSFHMFEACIEAKSYFQVWALVEPSTLQKSILPQLPPLMSEDDFRQALIDLEEHGQGDLNEPGSIFWPLFIGSQSEGHDHPLGRDARVIDQNLENTWMPSDTYLVTGYQTFYADGTPQRDPQNIFDQNENGVEDFEERLSRHRADSGCGSIVFTWSDARQMWLILYPPICG